MNKLFRFILLIFLFLATVHSGMTACGGDDRPDLMIFPSIVAIDSGLNRVFVIDNSGNRINLVDAVTDFVITKEDDDEQPILSDEDPQLIQLFPSNAALASLTGGVSRLFIIGANNIPSQEIIVLDYSGGDTLTTASISPINVPSAGTSDVLVGIAVDAVRGNLFVTNATTGQLHIYDVETGVEDPNSPINLGGEPAHLAVDPDSGLLAVSNAAMTTVSFVDLTDLTAPVATLDVGLFTRGIAMATNGSGSVLFLSGSGVNIGLAYLLNLADLATSNQIFSITPPAPTDPLPDPLLLTGNLNFISAGNLTDGRMGSYFTQSTGDLFILDLSNDLGTLNPTIFQIGAISAEGVANLYNSSGQVTKVYYASPGTGVLTVVDPLTNDFLDQIP